MAGKSQPMSTFAIRFNPASVADDDDDELYDIGTRPPRKEVLQFERRSASPPPSSDIPVNPVEASDAGVAAAAEQVPALHPSMLWKSQTHPVRSAPVSETTSPVSPLKTNTPSENDKSAPNRDVRTPGGVKDDPQRSIFSELRERIVNQSREMLPKRLNKTGSADTAKIVMTPAADDDKSAVEKETKGIRGHSRPGSDGGEAIAKEILKAGSTECISGDWEKPNASSEVSVKKSLSVGQIASKQESNGESELQGTGDVNTSSSLFPANGVSMSELLSGDGRNSPDVVAAGIASDAPSAPELVIQDNEQRSLSYFSHRIKRVKPVLRVPAFLKTKNVLALLILFLSLLILPLPPFLSGFVAGSFFMALLATVVYNGFLAPARVKEIPAPRDLKLLSPLQVPEMKESKNTEGLFKGWMNELSNYDVNNYHINQTHSVFVTLEGNTMRLQMPKQGIAKRAMSDESIPTTVSFVRQKHYDLRGCEVTLLPSDLVEKRLWSKKYPICIEVSKRPTADPHDRVSRELTKRNSLGRIEGDFLNPDMKSSPASVARAAKSPVAGHIKHIFLFARSSREKEEWYRRFVAAAAETPWPTRMSDLLQKSASGLLKSHVRNGSSSSLDQQVLQHKRHGSMDSQCSSLSFESLPSPETDYARLAPEKNLVEYMSYMAKIMPASESGVKAPSSAAELCDVQLLWLNAIISRCFLDFLREKYWTNKIRDKIQKKLGKMHVPHFIDQLTVTGIELGPQVPVICRTSKPYLDDRGLWVDLDVSYGGGFCITMETKCNLMKLKSAPSVVMEEKPDAGKRSGAQFSDEEDSAESTTDEEGVEENSTEDDNSDRRSEPMSKKLLKFVDKISKSRYFQQATDYRYIKKAMEEVSNTRLVLNVEMKAVNGTLAVNIPPPPTNRIWYGFRGNPNLVLSAKPRVGEREVSLSHITDWIEKKLAIEFQRVFVMPNMDDIPISLMCEHLPSSQVTTTTV